MVLDEFNFAAAQRFQRFPETVNEMQPHTVDNPELDQANAPAVNPGFDPKLGM